MAHLLLIEHNGVYVTWMDRQVYFWFKHTQNGTFLTAFRLSVYNSPLIFFKAKFIFAAPQELFTHRKLRFVV